MGIEQIVSPIPDPVGDRLLAEFASKRWSRFTTIVAFARVSGVRHFDAPVREFIKAGGRADFTIGIDQLGTTYEAIWHLMHAVAPRGRVLIAQGAPGWTFHPKLYIFSDAPPDDAAAARALVRATRALVIVGSANLTEKGLFINDEAALAWSVDTRDGQQQAWRDLVNELKPWLTTNSELILGAASRSVLDRLERSGELPREVSQRTEPGAGVGRSGARRGRRRRATRRAPRRGRLAGPRPPRPRPGAIPAAVEKERDVLIARLRFGASRRWPQWELNHDVMRDFFGVVTQGATIAREAVKQSGDRVLLGPTPLVIGKGKNRRLELPEPDDRPDPSPAESLLVMRRERGKPFCYMVLRPGDPAFASADALNRAFPMHGAGGPTTRRVLLPFGVLQSAWPGVCPLA